jgi:glucoamylase
VLALGFASERESASTLALSALLQPFDAVWHRHVEAWEAWQAANVDPGTCQDEFREAAHVSAMVLRVHQDKTYLGAMVASLSIPWGSSTDDSGGYHLVWPRDLVESAGALLALGGWEEARNILRYLIATQREDGRWSQNQWLGGKAHWTGIQLDEAAFPVLLASALAEADALGGIQPGDMVAKALRFIALQGPATDQDRWEETPGINTFTLAAAIAALVCGAELLGAEGRRDLLLLADDWNSRIEDWCLGAEPGLVARHGVPAYYVRAAPPAVFADRVGIGDRVPVRNHDGECLVPADTLISTDPLQLVRFGLRRADDPLIVGTVRLIDALLRVETPSGTSWYRYNGDGYGEHEDGGPFDGTGRGRPWPLLSGERGHYELAAGREAEARELLRAMGRMGSRLGLLPEQVWEAEAIPAHFLFPGRPSGSAMPLVWAHAECMKLAASLRLGRPIDRPEPVWLRYGGQRPRARRAHWSRRMPVGWIRAGQGLRLLLENPATIRWQDGGEARTVEGTLGLHYVDLPTEALAPGGRFAFSIADGPEQQVRIVPAGD